MSEVQAHGTPEQENSSPSGNNGGDREDPTTKVNPTIGAEASIGGGGGGGNCRDFGDCGVSGT